MQEFNLDHDPKLFCVPAKSFPVGVKEAFETIERKLGDIKGRTFFGLSRGTKGGGIEYKAGVLETSEGEGEKYGFESHIVKKGTYLVETITNWQENMQLFSITFQKLLADPRLDWNSWCVEWYKEDGSVMCMVKINP